MLDQQEELSTIIKRIQSYELPQVDINELCSPCPSVDISQTLRQLNSKDNSCILDVRSESEFAESSIPGAHNIPLFNDEERHNVGLLFKQQSVPLAEQVGAYYAYNKQDAFLNKIKKWAGNRQIIVHCWRGGYRSKATTALLIKNGFNAVRLEGGHKAFRREVYRTLYETPINLISLSGKTGTGKSEILEYIQENHPDVPVLHIEAAANHASSVFGPSRFQGSPVSSQQDFETRLYMQLVKHKNDDGSFPTFLTEKESAQIGNVHIPNGILDELKKEQHIQLESSIKHRVKRAYKEYVEGADDEKLTLLRKQIQYLKRYLSNESLEEYLNLFDQHNWDSLLEKVLVEYYDKVYRNIATDPLAVIEHEDTEQAVREVLKNLKKITSKT